VRPWALLATTVLTLSLAPAAAAGPAQPSLAGSTHAATPCSRSLATSSKATADQSASRRPVVFVHGWNGNGNVKTGKQSLKKLAGVLKGQLNDQIQPYFYDYGQVSTTWASRPDVAGCLGKYVNDVSKAFNDPKVGGDGKVLIVAHSMGGLATLYATDGKYTTEPIGPHLAGVVTLDTPYLGSPWGGTQLAGLLEQVSAAGVPPPASDAGRCLGLRAQHGALPADCGDKPPLLPAGVPLQQIAGSIAVHRSFFGFAAYDLPLASDAVVSVDSAHSYLDAAASAASTRGQKTRFDTDSCLVDYSAIQDMILSKAFSPTPAGLIAAGLVELAQLNVDSTAMDAAVSGHLTPGAVVYDAAAIKIARCSHLNVVHDQSAMNMATEALRADLAADPVTLSVTAADLLTAPVPPLCTHPGGRLVHGSLPGLDVSQGYEFIQAPGAKGLSGPFERPVLSDLTGDGAGEAVAVLHCSAGGVGWPDTVLVYGPGPRLLGALDLFKLAPVKLAPVEHAGVSSLKLEKGGVRVSFETYQGCCNLRASWSVHFEVHGDQLVLGPLVSESKCPQAPTLYAATKKTLPADEVIQDVTNIQCSGDWAVARVAFGIDGSAMTKVFKRTAGQWTAVDPADHCTGNEIPVALRNYACGIGE
jgi:pimeloyl-ACP methyl ester carboxylesterase